MAKKTFFLSALFCVILLGCSTSAASLPEFTAPVVDSIGRVSAEVETQINSELTSFQQTGGPQIAVAVVDTTGNATLENYSIDLARSWGIGDKEKDNGVLLLIALEDRTLRIEVGSGVEGELTDVTARRIVDTIMLPRLRANDVDGAVRDGARAVMQVWREKALSLNQSRQAHLLLNKHHSNQFSASSCSSVSSFCSPQLRRPEKSVAAVYSDLLVREPFTAAALAVTEVDSAEEASAVLVEAAAVDSAAAERAGVGNASVVERQCSTNCRGN